MCGIYLAQNKLDFHELALANSYRGNDTSSISVIDLNGNISTAKFNNGYNKSQLDEFDESYILFIIGHTQSATTKDSVAHPVTLGDSHLWHNGVIKAESIRDMQSVTGLETSFDTELMLNYIDNVGFNGLNDIDGGFSCFYYTEGKLFIFHNSVSPLFVGDNTFSSVKLKNMKAVEVDKVFRIGTVVMTPIFEFKTKNNPFFFT